jgi:hypothetical protein
VLRVPELRDFVVDFFETGLLEVLRFFLVMIESAVGCVIAV